MDIFYLVSPFFIATVVLSFIISAYIVTATKGIQFYGQETDNHFVIDAAAKSSSWIWPSHMHKPGMIKTYMKDSTILALTFFQKLMNNNKTYHPMIVMLIFANFISCLLIYTTISHYWGPMIGFIITMFFMVSFWIWQVALYGSHISLGIAVFLVSIFILQRIDPVNSIETSWWLVAAGAAFGMTMFASASTRKFIVIFLAAVIYSLYAPLIQIDLIGGFTEIIAINSNDIINIYIPIVIAAIMTLAWIVYRPLVRAVYQKKLPSIISTDLKGRDHFDQDHYLGYARMMLAAISVKIISLLAFAVFAVNFIGLTYLIPLILGFLLWVALMTAPDFQRHIRGWFTYYYFGKKTHFKHYTEQFKDKGQPISQRGAGWIWIYKFFAKFSTVIVALFAVGIIYFLVIFTVPSAQVNALNQLILIALIGLSPILWGEFTYCPQLARTYLPGMIGLLLPLAFFSGHLEQSQIFTAVIAALVIHVILNAYIFYADLLPSVMSSAYLIKTLREKGIKKFYTYRTDYNNGFINNIDQTILREFDINYIDSMTDIDHGYLVVPGTSSKGVTMETESEAINNGDYLADSALNDLFANDIKKSAEYQFKTMNSSKYWVHESEVTSYRDLIWKEISDFDRLKGCAWIIKVGR